MDRSATLRRLARGRSPAPGRKVGETESILIPEGLGVFPLSRVHPLRIGRSPTSDLVIPVSAVSRSHALVEWRGGGFHIRDLLSRNGTRVNGRRIACRRLRAGDRIDIGGLPVRYGEREAVGERGEAPRKGNGKVPGRAILRGDLHEVRLQEIIPFLVTQSRSGVLEVQGDRQGWIYLARGDLMHARLGHHAGEEAFCRLIEAARGSFVFQEGPIRVRRTIRRSAVALILEASRRRDEERV
jgi:hypothetical protein